MRSRESTNLPALARHRRGALLAVLAGLAACSDYEVEQVRRDEFFSQPGEIRSADVLFVVDDSASMDEEQTLLGENFSAFVAVLTDTYADYQIGVTTTDVSGADAGLLHGGVLTPATEDLSQAFQEAVAVGTGGSRDEQGLWAAVLAADPTRNPGFVRPRSRFNVVFVSDEDDHSPELVSVYLGALEEAAGDGGFVAHALVGDMPLGCVSGTSAADAGERYLEAVEATTGWKDSICADSYTALLTQVGLEVAGWEDTFVLGDIPAPNSLLVWVDGVAIPERVLDGWQYSAGLNAIVFKGRAVPRPGMEVHVEYAPWSGPAAEDTGATPADPAPE